MAVTGFRLQISPSSEGFVCYDSQMIKREAQFTTKFRKWLRGKVAAAAVAYEIKITNGNSIPFSAVQEHQIGALKQVKHNFFSYKIPDAGWQNPFDLLILSGAESYVVLAYEHVDKPKYSFYIIDIDEFLRIQELEERKSATEGMLEGYGFTRHTF